MHLQRVVGAYIASACGASQFYSRRVTQARDPTSNLANEDRDEDRAGSLGIDNRPARARRFIGETGRQACGLLAAAEGAVSA